MDFTISTPALLFSAISLFMLSFTNRFHTVATLVRSFISSYQENPEPSKLRQIQMFKKRLQFIQLTQALGVLSFLLCAVSMAVIMLGYAKAAELVFMTSLGSLILSLIFAMVEVLMSISALKVELEKIGCDGQGCGEG